MQSELEIRTKFGAVLKELRVGKKISQEKLALESGIDRTYISLLEKGKRNVTIKILFSICQVLEIAPSEFLKKLEAL